MKSVCEKFSPGCHVKNLHLKDEEDEDLMRNHVIAIIFSGLNHENLLDSRLNWPGRNYRWSFMADGPGSIRDMWGRCEGVCVKIWNWSYRLCQILPGIIMSHRYLYPKIWYFLDNKKFVDCYRHDAQVKNLAILSVILMRSLNEKARNCKNHDRLQALRVVRLWPVRGVAGHRNGCALLLGCGKKIPAPS